MWTHDERSGESAAPRRETPERCTVFVVSNGRIQRDALVTCLAEAGDLEVVGSAEEKAADWRLAALNPAVVVVDTTSVLDARFGRHLLEIAPSSRLFAFGLSSRSVDAGWIEAGISGCAWLDADANEVRLAIRQLAEGRFSCCAETTALLFRRLADLSNPRAGMDDAEELTSRELQVLRLLEVGLCNKEIARKLGMSSATVKNHVHSILGKLRIHRRSEVPARVRSMRRADQPIGNPMRIAQETLNDRLRPESA